MVLFTQRIDEDIAEDDPVRVVNAVVESLNLEYFRKLYKERGRSPYNPKMLLKVVNYAYMNNIYSCRKIDKRLLRYIHFIWLDGYNKPDIITINRFCNCVKNEIKNIFTQLVLILADKGFVSLDVEYIDGTKIESKANKYTFVWCKTVDKNRAKLMKKISVLLLRIDDAIAKDNVPEDEKVEVTSEQLSDIIGELRQSFEQSPAPEDKEQKRRLRERKKQIKELETQRDKLSQYDGRLKHIGDRNSMSKPPARRDIHAHEGGGDEQRTDQA